MFNNALAASSASCVKYHLEPYNALKMEYGNGNGALCSRREKNSLRVCCSLWHTASEDGTWYVDRIWQQVLNSGIWSKLQLQILQSDLTESPINGIECIIGVPGIVADRQAKPHDHFRQRELEGPYSVTHYQCTGKLRLMRPRLLGMVLPKFVQSLVLPTGRLTVKRGNQGPAPRTWNSLLGSKKAAPSSHFPSPSPGRIRATPRATGVSRR